MSYITSVDANVGAQASPYTESTIIKVPTSPAMAGATEFARLSACADDATFFARFRAEVAQVKAAVVAARRAGELDAIANDAKKQQPFLDLMWLDTFSWGRSTSFDSLRDDSWEESAILSPSAAANEPCAKLVTLRKRFELEPLPIAVAATDARDEPCAEAKPRPRTLVPTDVNAELLEATRAIDDLIMIYGARLRSLRTAQALRCPDRFPAPAAR